MCLRNCCWNDRAFSAVFFSAQHDGGKLPRNCCVAFFWGLVDQSWAEFSTRNHTPIKSSPNNTTICHFFVYIRHFHTLLNHFLLCLIKKQIVSHLLCLLSSSKELIFCRLEENLDNHFQATQTQHRKVFGKQTINITLLETNISYHQSALKRVDDLAPFFWGAIWTCSLEGSFLLEFSHGFLCQTQLRLIQRSIRDIESPGLPPWVEWLNCQPFWRTSRCKYPQYLINIYIYMVYICSVYCKKVQYNTYHIR